MNVLVSAVSVFLLLASPAFAQSLPIHGHSQKAAYNSPAEWPTVSSQCHWQATLSNPMTSHTHLDITAPYYGELSGPIRVPFALKLFHTAGRASIPMDYQHQVTKIEWDATGSDVPPVIEGDPHGLRTWTGHVTFDPSITQFQREPSLHGWWSPQIVVLTLLNDGAGITQEFFSPFWLTRDTSAPIPEWPAFPALNSRCAAGSPPTTIPPTQWGNNLVDTGSFLPLAPIFAPWPMAFGTAAYGGLFVEGNDQAQTRMDLDLHNNVDGTILALTIGNGDLAQSPILDPALMGAGTHKIAFMRFTPDRDEMVTTLLVFDVTVGAGVPPPPPLCQNPAASNVGRPLPCVFTGSPPPPPPPTPTPTLTPTPTPTPPWSVISEIFQRVGYLLGLCAADRPCVLPGPSAPCSWSAVIGDRLTDRLVVAVWLAWMQAVGGGGCQDERHPTLTPLAQEAGGDALNGLPERRPRDNARTRGGAAQRPAGTDQAKATTRK